MYNMQAVCTNIRDLRQESTTRPSARPRRQHKTFLGLSTSAVPTMGGKYSLVDTFWIVYQIGQMFGCFPRLLELIEKVSCPQILECSFY